MDTLSAELIFRWYTDLENQLVEYTRHAPPYESNLKGWSPTTASIIMSGCGLLDSLFRGFSAPLLGKYSIKKNVDALDIVDYCTIFESEWKLSLAKGIFLVSPPEMLSPFGPWSGSTYSSLSWWKVHNDLKHDLLSNIKCATVEIARDTLCGVLIAISLCKELYPQTLRQEWLNPRGYGIDHLLESLGSESIRLIMETKLFAIPFGYRNLSNDINLFDPISWQASSRVVGYFR
jgi:hypothetical protein